MSATLILEGISVKLADRDRSFTLTVPEFTLETGAAVGLTGPSGTGKTLLLETLGLLRRPQAAGQFKIASQENLIDLAAVWASATMPPAVVRGTAFGFVPQSGGLLPFLTVAENVALSQKIAGVQDPEWCGTLLNRLGIADIASLYPGALSIGQRQRVAICRALAHRPSFVIADEPTAALDPDAAATAMGLLIDMAASDGAGVIISSHDLDLLNRFALRRVTLDLVSEPGASAVVSQLQGQTTQAEATV